MTNYALSDFYGIATAFLIFPLLTFFPGYLIGYAANLWKFRLRTSAFQVAASIPLSLSVGPLLTFVSGRYAWVIYGICLGSSIVIFLRTLPAIDKTFRQATIVALSWAIFAAVWLMDWQFGSRVYFPIYALDYSTRAAMVHSLATFGLPAQTPFFYPGHPVALHYHFLWLLQCSLIPGTPRLVFIAGAIWCGLGLMCVAALAMRILAQQRSWIVIGLLSLTGLDIIPSLLILLGNRLHILNTLPPSAEWWNDQVDGWIYTALWQPHYICALIACITGFLLIWECKRWISIIMAACCFATAVGSGSFVALVFAAFLVVWMLANYRHCVPLFYTGILTVVFSLPYLATLRSPAENAGGGSLLALTVRSFLPIPLSPMFRLLALPLNYFLELGFFAVCVCIGYRRKLARHESALLLMSLVSVLICTFVKSGATPNNDLGWRGFLVAQFALLILSASYLHKVKPSRLLTVLLILGVCGTVYDLVLTRTFPMLSDAGQVPKLKWLSLHAKLGERTRANRDAYRWIQNHSPQQAILGQNPNNETIDLYSTLYADRRIMAGDRSCTSGFGGSAEECRPVENLLAKVFNGEVTIGAACRELPANFYTVKDTDPIWQTSQKWQPDFQNDFVRVFSCRQR